jgi:hypothetical protein
MGGGGGGRGRSRTQRRHFKQSRENVWKRPKSDPSSENNNSNDNDNNNNVKDNRDPHWQPFATQNPGFDDYYKVYGIEFRSFIYSNRLCAFFIFLFFFIILLVLFDFVGARDSFIRRVGLLYGSSS